MKGKKVMKKILVRKILKLCFISSWRISRVFSVTVFSHLHVCKKQVIAALCSKRRINKMRSLVSMLKIQISGNFLRPVPAFPTRTRMRNARKLLIKTTNIISCNSEILWSVHRPIAWEDILTILKAIKSHEKMEFQTCIRRKETRDFLEAKILLILKSMKKSSSLSRNLKNAQLIIKDPLKMKR